MSSDSPQSGEESADWVDLLYDDELEDEEARRRRDELEPAQRTELERSERLLGRIRSNVPDEEVSDSLHQSILERAEAERSERTSPDSGGESPEPGASQTSSGVWNSPRARRTGTAAAAAALLALGFGVTWYVAPTGRTEQGSGSMQARRAAPQQTSESPPSTSGDERTSREQGERIDPNSPNTSEEKKRLAQRSSGSLSESDDSTPASPRSSSTDASSSSETAREAPASGGELTREKNAQKTKRRRAESDPSTGESSGPTRSERIAQRGASRDGPDSDEETSSSSESRASTSDSESRAEGAGGAPAYAEPKEPEERHARGIEDSSETHDEQRPPRRRAANRSDDNTGIGRILEDKTQPSAPSPDESEASSGTSRESAIDALKGDSKARETQTKESVDLMSIQEAYTDGRPREAIRLADALLESGEAEPGRRARALHLKAQSYEALEQWRRAASTYEQLQDRYPSYHDAQIEEAIQDVEQHLREDRRSENGPASSSSVSPSSE